MKAKTLTVTDLAAVIAGVLLLGAVAFPAVRGSKQTAARLLCRANLRGLGRVLAVYAADNEGDFPRAGGKGSTWNTVGLINRWMAPVTGTEEEAFGINPGTHTGGRGTITSCWYLLVRDYSIMPDQFVCPGDGAYVFDIQRTEASSFSRTLETVWDFGGCDRGLPLMPGEMVSYAYQMPYARDPSNNSSSFGVDWQSPSKMPVCADRNPHLDKNAVDPNVSSNSAAHGGRGQNVLFKDGSVKLLTTPTAGIRADNIYTYGGDPALAGGDPQGTPPVRNGDGGPTGRNDAYLVSEVNYQ